MGLKVSAQVLGRDEIHIEANVQGETLSSVRLSGIGCPALLRLLAKWRPLLVGSLKALPVPDGRDHSSILLREAILRLKGEWNFPYKEEELCHCRAIPCLRVDAAIVYGASTAEEVARLTSAGTGCGTCRRDTEEIIKYRIV